MGIIQERRAELLHKTMNAEPSGQGKCVLQTRIRHRLHIMVLSQMTRTGSRAKGVFQREITTQIKQGKRTTFMRKPKLPSRWSISDMVQTRQGSCAFGLGSGHLPAPAGFNVWKVQTHMLLRQCSKSISQGKNT